MSGTAPRYTGHVIRQIKFFGMRDPRPRTLVCECKWSVAVLPDTRFADRDQPLIDAYAAHMGKVNRKPRLGTRGWQRMSLTSTDDREYVTAMGRSKLSAVERGRMGAEANRRKRAAASK